MSESLIQIGGLTVSLDAPVEAKAEALESSALIGKVRNATENELAVQAQAKLKSVLQMVEASRKTVKAPVIELGRAIDRVASEFINDVKAEDLRIGRLIGDFQQLEIAKLKSAEAARLESLTDLEKRREEELATATTHEERDEIQARYNEEARQQAAVQPVRAAGQVVKEDYEVEVDDPAILARCHYPELCSITPKVGAIKEAIRQGRKVYGVSAKPVVTATVRVTKQKALTV